MLVANAPITATLRPVVSDSVGKDGTLGGFDSDNLYIEGDNLEVLKLLQETYLSKLKKKKEIRWQYPEFINQIRKTQDMFMLDYFWTI